MDLADRLRSWAQNEEMVNAGFTAHGKDCNAAADCIAQLQRQRDAIVRWGRMSGIPRLLREEMQIELANIEVLLAQAKGQCV